MFRLLFQNRQDREPFVPRDSVTSIGRDAGCSLQLVEPGISDQHAAIERRADGFYIRALAGPVRVNGEALGEKRLRSGDEIELGATRLLFEIVPPPVAQRSWDLWQAVAVAAVSVLLAGQIGVFAWIFAQPHPRGARTDIIKGGRLFRLAPEPAPVEPTRPLLPLPATPTSDVGAPASPVLNRMIRIVRVTDKQIQIKAQVAERALDPSQVAVSVQCPDGVRWLPVPSDWENFTSRVFPAPCAGTVRTYYRNNLQDEWSTP